MAWKTAIFLLVLQQACALPTEVHGAELALITPAPTLMPTKTQHKRGLLSDLTSAFESDVGSLLSEIGSGIPSYVASGILPAFENLPTGDAVLKSAGLNSSDLAAVPTQVLNIPNYGNWTDIGWNLRLRGNVFKQPNISNETIDKLANQFLINTRVQDLPPSQSAQAVNLTREIYVVQQDQQNVTINIAHAPLADGSATPSGNQTITLPLITTPEGDFDSFVQLQNVTDGGLLPGYGTVAPQALSLHTEGTDTGNATSYLVSDEGITIVSDIDDILRITKIYEPAQGLLNSFARPFVPWRNMPDIYHNLSESVPTMHFHYLTTTPEQITRNYMQFIYDTYPGGSFDTRPLNFSDLSATISIRKYLLVKIFETFPHRKFILVADTSNSDVMRDYPLMGTMFPNQLQCIWLRNTSATDPGDKFPYDTSGFKDLNQTKYMFFVTPDDLTNLDVEKGECWNRSIVQNVTFGYQGLPFGIGNGASSLFDSRSFHGMTWATLGSVLVSFAGALAFAAL